MNERYEAKFGHIFIICASGKAAEDMLAAVQQRQVPVIWLSPSPALTLRVCTIACSLLRSSPVNLANQENREPVPAGLTGAQHEHPPARHPPVAAPTKVTPCCRSRYGNEPHAELQIAAAEQMAITELRLHKLLDEGGNASSGGGGATAATGNALAQVARRAGQIGAHLGACASLARMNRPSSEGHLCPMDLHGQCIQAAFRTSQQ